MPQVLTRLEQLLPAWELNMNRHMMLHLAAAVRQHGPCWAWSMFGFERLWDRLTRCMFQTSHPEATMIKSWKAFITCCIADPSRVEELHHVSDKADHASAAAGELSIHYLPETFDKQTYQLKLPDFMQSIVSTPVVLFDSCGAKEFGTRRHKDRHGRRAELHLLYCKMPGLCKPCSCTDAGSCSCLQYHQLWDKFLTDPNRGNPTKQQLPASLVAWRAWAIEQSDLSEDARASAMGLSCL